MPKKVIKNVKLKWCNFNKVDQYGKYSCQIDLTKAQAKELESWGIKGVKKDDDGALFLRVRREGDKGMPEVKDASLIPVTVSISNGATANVMLDVYEYKRYGGGIACRLEKVQVLKWEPYGEEIDFEDESGGVVDGGESKEGPEDRLF